MIKKYFFRGKVALGHEGKVFFVARYKKKGTFLSCCGFDSYISFQGKKSLSTFGTVYNNFALPYECHFLFFKITALYCIYLVKLLSDRDSLTRVSI